MSKNALVIVVIVLVALLGAWYFYAMPAAEESQDTVGIANPASTNCVETLGGTLEIVDGAEGQYGLCHLPDGRACEEWALFRDNECIVLE